MVRNNTVSLQWCLITQNIILQWCIITQNKITAVVPDYSKHYHCSGV